MTMTRDERITRANEIFDHVFGSDDGLERRLDRAIENLEDLIAGCGVGDGLRVTRLAGKIEGVKLALSYLQEGQR